MKKINEISHQQQREVFFLIVSAFTRKLGLIGPDSFYSVVSSVDYISWEILFDETLHKCILVK